MKKLIYFIAVLIITGISSCKKEFIQLISESTVSVNLLYKTDKDFQDAVIGIYNGFRAPYLNYWRFGDLRGDDTRFGLVSGLEDIRINDFISDVSDPVLISTWRNYYIIITRANMVINSIENTDPAVIINKDRHKAEAEFLRALAYFDMVKIFGDVPLIIKNISVAEAYKIPREKVRTIYDEIIIKDLQDAETKLPKTYTGADIGRATSGAAKSLLAKVYLTLKEFPNAEAKLQEVTTMGYSLLTNYNDLWDYAKNKHHTEYIFNIEYAQGQGSLGSNFTGQFSLDFQAGGGPLVAEEVRRWNIPSGTGGDSGIPNPTIFDAYSISPGDKRQYVSATRGIIGADGVLIPIAPTGVPALTLKYMSVLIGSASDCNADWKVIRYADVLLMYAEALNENGKTIDALTNLNLIRVRAGVPTYTGLSQSDIREKIYLERRLEFYMEGQRWFDLVRTGRALTVMAPFGMKDYMTVFPIPQTQIDIIGDPAILSQNPGY